jgi:uncharacterized protein
MEKKHVFQIVILTILSCTALFIVEQVLIVSYLWKTLAKIGLFLVVPLLYIRIVLKQPILKFLNLKNIDFSKLRLGFILGLLSMGIVIGAFFLFSFIIDTNTIIADLESRGITASVFIFIAVYITFGNSLLEEFYFRGFLFLNIYRSQSKLFAYLFSSLLFALYHIGIFMAWFNIWLILLALLGLFVVGLIFNWLNTKSDNFLNSWILHILADVGVMVVGFYVLGFFG